MKDKSARIIYYELAVAGKPDSFKSDCYHEMNVLSVLLIQADTAHNVPETSAWLQY